MVTAEHIPCWKWNSPVRVVLYDYR